MANAFLQVMSGAGAVASGISNAFIWFLFASPLLAAVFVVLLMKKYKHTIILRLKTKGDTDKILITKFAVQKKKGQPEQIKTFARRLDLPIPPEEAIDIKDNGSWFCEGYLTEGGEVTWITAEAKRYSETIEKEHSVPMPSGKKHIVKEKTTVEKYKDIKLTKLSTQDKAFYFNREKQANDKYAVGGFWEFVNRHAGVIGLVMVVFVLFLFWGDIMEPAIQAKQIDQQRMQLELEIVGKLDQIINNRQTIPDAPVYNTTEPPKAPE